jgi:phage repressor protein C with HTH and peptisase S24 domain
MSDMEKLSDRLSFALQRSGLSQAELARRVGMKQPSISAIITGETTHTKFAPEMARELGVAVEWLLTGEGPIEPSPQQQTPILEVDPTRIVEIPDRTAMPLNVPVYGIAVGGSAADFQLNGEIVDYVRRPPGLMNAKRVFAIYVQGESMEPRYENGDLVYLNPDRPARSGDDVVIQMKPNGHKAGDCFIKRLVRRTPTQIVCRQFNPPAEVVYGIDEVDKVFKVLTSAELMGV